MPFQRLTSRVEVVTLAISAIRVQQSGAVPLEEQNRNQHIWVLRIKIGEKNLIAEQGFFAQNRAPFPTSNNTIAGRITAGFRVLLAPYILATPALFFGALKEHKRPRL